MSCRVGGLPVRGGGLALASLDGLTGVRSADLQFVQDKGFEGGGPNEQVQLRKRLPAAAARAHQR